MTVRQTLLLILTPIVAMCVLSFGSGFFTTFSAMENNLSRSNFMLGIISAAYFLGMTVGSYFSQFTIKRVGYIRAFVIFASLMAVSTLTLGVFKGIGIWILFMFMCGYALAALFLIIESWCILSSEKKDRGLVFSIYLFVYYGTQALSQLTIIVNFNPPLLAYCFISSLCSIAMILMASTKNVVPAPHSEEVCSPKKIIQKAPLAIVAGLVSGAIIGSVYSILPGFLERIGSSRHMISIFMMMVILGGMFLQVPIGKLSDIIDRRKVILFAAFGIIVTSICVFIFYKSYILFLIMLFLFGGCAFVIYPLAISHASDFLEEHEILGAIGVITIAYSVGSVIGPMIISNFMTIVGPFGFFIIMGIAGALLCVYTFYRLVSRENAIDIVQFTAVTPESVGFSEAQEVVYDKLSE